MDKVKSLAEHLGVAGPASSLAENQSALADLSSLDDPYNFAQAVIHSIEFRKYIVGMLVLGTMPAAILLRLMDLAGWQKPPERVEHTGKDGAPIVTEVRRVIVHRQERADCYDEDGDEVSVKRLTH